MWQVSMLLKELGEGGVSIKEIILISIISLVYRRELLSHRRGVVS